MWQERKGGSPFPATLFYHVVQIDKQRYLLNGNQYNEIFPCTNFSISFLEWMMNINLLLDMQPSKIALENGVIFSFYMII